MEIVNNPPAALLPRSAWIRSRIADIKNAIIRYEQDGEEVPGEWRQELALLTSELEDPLVIDILKAIQGVLLDKAKSVLGDKGLSVMCHRDAGAPTLSLFKGGAS